MARTKIHKYDDMMIPLLLEGGTHAHVALLCGCGISTVQRRLKDPDFCAMMKKFQTSLAESALAKLSMGMDAAVETLNELRDEKHSATVRLAAARAPFDIYPKLREVVAYEKRMADMEAKLIAIEKLLSEAGVNSSG